MFKVLKNLKQSWISVVVIIALLCLQAAVDLELPNYTSKIVNVGIQTGGIEDSVPDVINQNDMEAILLLTDEDNKILENYEGPNSDGNYEVKDLNDEQREELSDIMIKPVIIFSSLQSEEEQLEQMLKTTTEQIDQMQDSIKEQAGVANVKIIYQNAGVDTDQIQMNYIMITGLKMLGLAAVSMACGITIMMLSARVGARLARTLREKVFTKVLSFSNKELREFSTASLITRSTNDVQQIQQLMAMLFRTVVYAPIIGIGGILKVLSQSNSSMAWIIGLAVITVLIVVAGLFAVAMPKFKKLQDLVDKLNKVSREILTGLPVIRAFNTEKKEEKRFDDANTDLMKTNMFVNRAMSVMMPMLMLIMNGVSILIIWVGGHNVDQGIMQVGDMLAFIQYAMQIVMSFLMISMISIMLPRASVSANRIMEVIETEPSIKDKKETKKLDPNKKGLVEFKNVSFR